MVVVIRRCTRHHAGLDPASIGFLLSQEWYWVLLDSCFRRNGNGYYWIPVFAGMVMSITGFLLSQEWWLSYGAVPVTMPGLTRHPLDSCFRRNGIGYYWIPAFAGMVVVIRRCTRHHAGLDPASIGFLLSQEW